MRKVIIVYFFLWFSSVDWVWVGGFFVLVVFVGIFKVVFLYVVFSVLVGRYVFLVSRYSVWYVGNFREVFNGE